MKSETHVLQIPNAQLSHNQLVTLLLVFAHQTMFHRALTTVRLMPVINGNLLDIAQNLALIMRLSLNKSAAKLVLLVKN
uniref:Uncharacterized protein n=1 Tax=Acrobeloides nanus TaxID=290746 RepID=A0A914EMW0_9BILA